jgi:hypothetical protein
MGGTPTDPNIKLNAGNDSFLLESGAAIDSLLRVDFGGGNDTLTSNFGNYTFNANLLNLNGFDRFYDLATDSLNMEQDMNVGPVTLGTSAGNGAVRLTSNAIVTEMTKATDVRLIFMANTTNSVTVDLDSALAGSLVLQLRDGSRNVTFTGSNNSVGDLLRIEASLGVQSVVLASVADLNVGGNLVVNGRDGNDILDDGANDVFVGGDLLLRGINDFRINNTLTVGGNFNIITVLETQNTILVNNGNVSVAGSVHYLGGAGADEFLFNSGSADITGYTYINLADSGDASVQQRVRLVGNYSTDQLLLVGSNATAGNSVVIGPSANIAGDVVVNFAGTSSNNSAIFQGTYGGTYGTFRGGSGVDNVVLGADALDMYFVSFHQSGDDAFTLENTTVLDRLLVDFGAGDDTLVDLLGQPYPFPAHFNNL